MQNTPFYFILSNLPRTIIDQNEHNCCVACAIIYALQILDHQHQIIRHQEQYSYFSLYYLARFDPQYGYVQLIKKKYENNQTVLQQIDKEIEFAKGDIGTTNECALQVVQRIGVCKKSHTENKHTVFLQSDMLSSPYCVRVPLHYQKLLFPTVKDIQNYLLQGYPILVSILIFNQVMSTFRHTFYFPLPSDKTSSSHSLLVVGYDDYEEHFISLNSWGITSGDKGFCYIPYSYLDHVLTVSQTCEHIQSTYLERLEYTPYMFDIFILSYVCD